MATMQNTIRTYDLSMTMSGMSSLLVDTRFQSEKNKPQIYIHTGIEGPLTDQVIRIGTAKNGAFERWRASSGHCKAFLYAIGADKGYSRPWKYPDYLAFFAGLAGINTQLHIFTHESDSEMYQEEKRLIKQVYGPVWEDYLKAIKGRHGYFKQHPESQEAFTRFGGALELITRQRNGESPLYPPMPDVLDFRSTKPFQHVTTLPG